MEEWIGGRPSKDTRPIIRQKVSEYLQEQLHKDMKFEYQDIIKIMNTASRCYKKVNLIQTRSAIEYEKYGYTSLNAAIPRDENVAIIYIFATMLGYIDSVINQQQEKINYNSRFIDFEKYLENNVHVDAIDKSNGFLTKYLKDRDEVLEGYISIMDGVAIKYEYVLDILEMCPSYENFDKIKK